MTWEGKKIVRERERGREEGEAERERESTKNGCRCRRRGLRKAGEIKAKVIGEMPMELVAFLTQGILLHHNH